MDSLDVIAAIILTGSSAIFVAALAAIYPGNAQAKLRLAASFTAWFAVLVTLCGLGVFHPVHGLGTRGLGLAVLLPMAIIGIRFAGSPEGRATAAALPLSGLTALHSIRVLGIFFFLLQASNRLPAPFAPVAGGGDIFIGLTALPLAWTVKRQVSAWRSLALAWNLLGTLDLITAIGLGITSAPDAPLRLFGGVGTAAMTTLPWMIIPGFLVPILFMLHVAALAQLGWVRSGQRIQAVPAT